MVSVSVGGYLGFYPPGHQRKFEFEADAGLRISEIIRQLGLPPVEVALISLNGNLIDDLEVLVPDGAELKLFSATDGG